MKITEKLNPDTVDIDKLDIAEILHKINLEDMKVSEAVSQSLTHIELFISKVIDVMKAGGKLFYVGSGTSGRLGVLDASECPPTFGVENEIVQGIIAGGEKALMTSIEGAEDNEDAAASKVRSIVTDKDIVLGISASSATPYVLAALKEANILGAYTGILVCNEFDNYDFIDCPISVIVGPEAIAGSTRMKAGTATKMILNMISTTAMIKMNCTYGNLMVNLKPLNKKLKDRSIAIVSHITGKNRSESKDVLKISNYQIKEAVLMISFGMELIDARAQLERNNGSLRRSLDEKR